MTTSRQMVYDGSEARKAGHRSIKQPAGREPASVRFAGYFPPTAIVTVQSPPTEPWKQTHNTTFEIASEIGISFTISVIAGWLGVFIVLGRGMTARRHDENFQRQRFGSACWQCFARWWTFRCRFRDSRSQYCRWSAWDLLSQNQANPGFKYGNRI